MAENFQITSEYAKIREVYNLLKVSEDFNQQTWEGVQESKPILLPKKICIKLLKLSQWSK